MKLIFKVNTGFLVILFSLCSFINSAQLSKAEHYNKIDNKIFLLSKKESLSIDSVINFVNKEFTLTEDKVRAYYTFISLNISYDVQRLDELLLLPTYSSFDGPMHCTISQNPQDVFEKKKGICEGISRLMVKFCEGSAIHAVMVAGHCKPPDGEFVKEIGHAWNAVKLDSAWALIDITWSFGYVNYKKEFVKQPSETFFLVSPQEFSKSHLPLDPMWQLSKNPVSKIFFVTEDTLTGKYYSLGFSFNDSINSYFKKTDAEKKYTSLLNYYKFDKEHKNTGRNLDVYVNNRAADKASLANIYFDDFITFYNTKLIKSFTKSNCKKALEMLNNSNYNLKLAADILKNKTAITPEFAEAFKGMKEEIRKNTIAINKNIKLVKEIQKRAK